MQTAIFSKIPLAGVTPNLMIMITSFYGFMIGRRSGAIVGFFCGFIMDLFSGSYFGAFALILMFLGYANGLFRRLFFGDDLKLPILFVGITDLLYCGMIYLVRFVPRGKNDVTWYFMNLMMPEMLYTLLVSVCVYFLVIRIFRWCEKDEKRSEATFVR